MNILRLLALLSITMLFIPMSASAHCAGKHGDSHPHCSGGGDDPSVMYEAKLQGAFVFAPLPVTLEGQDERLINSEDLEVLAGDEFAWFDVFYVCGLLEQSFTKFTASGGKKGWRIARPGGVYVQFPIPDLPSNGPANSGYELVDVSLQLIGDCAYSGGTEPCDPFPPVPGENEPGVSTISLTHFNIHARGEKGILHNLDICHSGNGALLAPTTLVITATEL